MSVITTDIRPPSPPSAPLTITIAKRWKNFKAVLPVGKTSIDQASFYMLSLYRTKVSNAGLAKLAGLKRLRALDLRYTRATGSGIKELVAGIPNCKIEFQDSSNRSAKRAPSRGACENRQRYHQSAAS